MAKRNAINLSATVNADGFNLGGGTTERTLTLTGGDVTINGSGSAVITFPASTSTLATLALTETLSNKSFSTAPLPSANDGAALGSATFQWSDLFLAEGAAINFDNGDLTLTQTGNNLAVGGGGHLTFGGADGSAIVDVAQSTAALQGLRIEGDAATALSFTTYVTGDAQLRFVFQSDGKLLWGSGAATADTNLYRGGANILKTDDTLEIVGNIELGAATDTTISRSSAGVIAVEGVVIPSISSTNTLTNKRITKRVTSVTDSATPTPNADTDDCYDLTALAQAATFAAPTGTPTNFQTLTIRIKDNGTARALGWNAAYVAGGVALPTTTVLSKILTLGFIYNTANTLNKWQLVASAQEA